MDHNPDVLSRLTVIEAILQRLELRLIGPSGDNGEIGLLKRRVTQLESLKYQMVGGFGTIVVIFEIAKFFKKG